MLIELHDEVALLRMHGGKGNAMTSSWLERLVALFGEFEQSDAKAVVVTGYDRFFSVGLALTEIIELDRRGMGEVHDGFSRAMLTVFSCSKPVVAAVNGHATAGGCALAIVADWRAMADGSSKIGLNESKLGIGLPAAILEPLRLLVPSASLLPIAMQGELFLPHEAQDFGLIDEVLPGEHLLSSCLDKAMRLADVSGPAFAQVKTAMRRPALEAIAQVNLEQREAWLDTWFSPPAQKRLREAVAKLNQR